MSKFRIEDYMQIGDYIEQMIWVFTKYPCTSRRFTVIADSLQVGDLVKVTNTAR